MFSLIKKVSSDVDYAVRLPLVDKNDYSKKNCSIIYSKSFIYCKDGCRMTKKLNSEILELKVLFEISQTLSELNPPEISLHKILGILSQKMGMKRGTITILDEESQDIQISVAHGLSEKEKNRGKYRIGEGITGKVVHTQKPFVVSSISDEPLFLDRTGSREQLEKSNIAFICVPIITEHKVIGTLSVDRLFTSEISLENDLRLLSVISSVVAKPLEKQRHIELEKKLILDRNKELVSQLKEIFRPEHIIGNSSPMKEVYRLLKQVAKSTATALIYGESGTGKELVASAIHYCSNRADGAFIKLNCAALPETLIESELFGHEAGAFTGAISKKAGRFELADGGTIFLDEIGELNLGVQAKLLRVLQEKELERIGGTKTIKINVRIIVATNKNLEESVKLGSFREDLYYRLCVFPINMPPLRERGADIILLANHFLAKYSKENGKNITRICSPAIDMMMAYHWPGNVRELENCIERAALLCDEDTIHGYHLPPTLQMEKSMEKAVTLKSRVENFEKELIQEALKRHNGNQTLSAKELGTTFRIINYKVKQYGIDPFKHTTKTTKD